MKPKTQSGAVQVQKWTRELARLLGELIERQALEKELPIAVAVFFDGQRIFHIGLPGSSIENDAWIEMKRRTVELTGESSLAWRQKMVQSGIDDDELPFSDGVVAMCGGGFPLRDQSGLRGVVIVSGLPHEDDHDLVVTAVRLISGEES